MNHASAVDSAREFLAQRSLALVGVSRNEKDYSRWLLRRLQTSGYTVFAVNPHGGEIDGMHCYKAVAEIPVPVDGALLMTPEKTLPHVIGECVTAGIPRVWIYGVGHPRKLDDETRIYCEQHGVQIINGLCPMMLLPDAAWPHHLHGWIARKIAYRPTVVSS